MKHVILVVDDSSTSRKILKKALKMTGLEIAEILEAEDGLQALEILDRREVHCVFADLNMPRMSGVQLVERMAEIDLLKEISVILVTSDRNRARLSGLLELGVRSRLNKPFHPEELREVVERVLALPGKEAR